jgi:hypothetical protein
MSFDGLSLMLMVFSFDTNVRYLLQKLLTTYTPKN